MGTDDWWLYDDSWLLVMRFHDGRRIENEIITDPSAVRQACAWRDLALSLAMLDTVPDAAGPSS